MSSKFLKLNYDLKKMVRKINLISTYFLPAHFLPKENIFSKGFKYLGFNLKPNNYRKEDWSSLIRKVEARIAIWVNILVSRGKRLVLIKAVLESIHIY
jgi:hypothetical protein